MKIQLVDEWKRLWKSFTIVFAALGIALPDVLQLIADNSAALPWFDDGYKSAIRLGCLVAIVLLRPIKQAGLKDEKNETDTDR